MYFWIESFKNISVITGGGVIYTVDEVSAMLGVPRPTLYRYLKEYSVPYQRRSGRISIPEESLDRIRMVRELHDEGLGTGAVRRRIREGGGTELDQISERLKQLERKLESAQSSLKPLENGASSQALQVILARQSLLVSSIFNLTEMMEELLAAAGRPRKVSNGLPGDENTSGLPPLSRQNVATLDAAPEISAYNGTGEYVEGEALSSFGSLARRRRRSRLILLLGVVIAVVLVVAGVFWAGATLL